MRTCELCGLPAPRGEPPVDADAIGGLIDWHPRDVQRVHRYPLVEFGSWGCSRCGQEFPVGASWAVDHRIGPQSAVRTFVVCPGCAGAVRPTRLRVDVDRIVSSGPRSLRALVETVRERRGAQGQALLLRAEDTHRLAASEDVSVPALVRELEARGLARVT